MCFTRILNLLVYPRPYAWTKAQMVSGAQVSSLPWPRVRDEPSSPSTRCWWGFVWFRV